MFSVFQKSLLYSVLFSVYIIRPACAEQDYIPTDLATQPPSCARACVNTLIGQEFEPFVCVSSPSSSCLCSKYQNTGPSLGDIFSYCISTYCDPDANIAVSPFYELCNFPSSKVYPTPHGLSADPTTAKSGSDGPAAAAITSPVTSETTGSKTSTTTKTSMSAMSESTIAPSSSSPTSLSSSASTSSAASPQAMTPGEIAGIAVGAVAVAIVLSIAMGALVVGVLSRRQRKQAGYLNHHPANGSRFGSAPKFSSPYEHHPDNGLGMKFSAELLKDGGFLPQPTHAAPFDSNETISQSSFRSTSRLVPLPHVKDSVQTSNLQGLLQWERTGVRQLPSTSALRPHPQPPQPRPIELPCTPPRQKPAPLKIQIPGNTANPTTVAVPSREAVHPSDEAVGLAVTTEGATKDISSRISTGPASPAPFLPPPPLPTGARRTDRPEYMPSYYSQTRRQQLSGPGLGMVEAESPIVSPESAGAVQNRAYPPTSFRTGGISGGEGVKMHPIRAGMRQSAASAATGETAFDSDDSSTPVEDDSPFAPTPVTPVALRTTNAVPPEKPTSSSAGRDWQEQTNQRPVTPKHQNAEAHQLLTGNHAPMPLNLRSKAKTRFVSHRRKPSIVEKRRGPEIQGALQKGLWITGSNGRSGEEATDEFRRAPQPHPISSGLQVQSHEASAESAEKGPRLTPTRQGPDGDMYIEVNL